MIDNAVKFYSVPLVINITLYKNNYVDNLIIGELRRNVYMMPIPKQKDHFSVTSRQFKKIMTRRFTKEVEHITNLPNEILSQNVNSAYFIYNILERFVNLEMLNIHISNNRKYTRIYKVDEQSMLGFNYKIIQGILDYPTFLNRDQLIKFNDLLKVLNINHTENISLDSYYIVRAQDFLIKISKLESDDKEYFNEMGDIIDITYELVEQKIEEDNAFLIIKTDFVF